VQSGGGQGVHGAFITLFPVQKQRPERKLASHDQAHRRHPFGDSGTYETARTKAPWKRIHGQFEE